MLPLLPLPLLSLHPPPPVISIRLPADSPSRLATGTGLLSIQQALRYLPPALAVLLHFYPVRAGSGASAAWRVSCDRSRPPFFDHPHLMAIVLGPDQGFPRRTRRSSCRSHFFRCSCVACRCHFPVVLLPALLLLLLSCAHRGYRSFCTRISIFVQVVSKGCKRGITPISKEYGKSQPLRALCFSLSRYRRNRISLL